MFILTPKVTVLAGAPMAPLVCPQKKGHAINVESASQEKKNPTTWPLTLKSTGRHGHFLNSTCDIGFSDRQQGLKVIVTCDITYS